MTPEQREEFADRANAVKYRHLINDPRLRRARRRLRLSMFSAVIGACVTIAVMLLLTKSFLLALHGPADYARVIVPSVQTLDDDSMLRRMLMPDPVSTGIADMVRPILQQSGVLATAVPASPDAEPLDETAPEA